MKLYEFFNNPIEISRRGQDTEADKRADELFWYIIDHDKLHKDYFFPIANKLKKMKECTPEQVLELYMPMVIKGCKEYYHDNELKRKLGKEFPKELRDDMCHKLHHHYKDDLDKDEYKLG